MVSEAFSHLVSYDVSYEVSYNVSYIRIFNRGDLSKGTAVQVLNEISIEYDFSEPSYIVKSLGKHQELPPFQATCEIFKNKITCSCIGKPAPHRKSAK